ncbi:hypothetical protein SANTM175S_05937 [Streptomyces antimycoticus]
MTGRKTGEQPDRMALGRVGPGDVPVRALRARTGQAQCLDGTGSLDGLGEALGDPCVGRALAQERLARPAEEPPGRDPQHRNPDQAGEGQQRAHHDQGAEGDGDGDQGGHGGGDRAAHTAREHLHVPDGAGDQIARARPFDGGQRQGEHIADEPLAQRGQDLLAQPRRGVCRGMGERWSGLPGSGSGKRRMTTAMLATPLPPGGGIIARLPRRSRVRRRVHAYIPGDRHPPGNDMATRRRVGGHRGTADRPDPHPSDAARSRAAVSDPVARSGRPRAGSRTGPRARTASGAAAGPDSHPSARAAAQPHARPRPGPDARSGAQAAGPRPGPRSVTGTGPDQVMPSMGHPGPTEARVA